MRFNHGPNGVLYAARYYGRCARCRGFLARGVPIFLLDEGWGCYACNLDDSVHWHRQRVVAEAEQLLSERRDDAALAAREPDDCSRPAKRLGPGR
jgi:hypothetical protein